MAQQTLVFNTTAKTVKVSTESGGLFKSFDSVPTVKVMEGFYEVMQADEFDKRRPVARFPIANTIMLIEN